MLQGNDGEMGRPFGPWWRARGGHLSRTSSHQFYLNKGQICVGIIGDDGRFRYSSYEAASSVQTSLLTLLTTKESAPAVL